MNIFGIGEIGIALALLASGLGVLAIRYYRGWQISVEKIYQKQQTGSQCHNVPLPELGSDLPLVSLLVAAWNEEEAIQKFLDSYSHLSHPNKELILCAGGTDQTYQIAKQWPVCKITLLQQVVGEGKYTALQRCLRQAHGTIIYLTDADCILDDQCFQRLVSPIADGLENVVTGGFKPLSEQLHQPLVSAQWLMEEGRGLHSAPHTLYSSFLCGANCALARATIEAGWENPLINSIGEDYYLALQIQRMGQQIRHCPECKIETHYPATMGDYIQRKSRWHRSWLLHHYNLGDRRWMRNLLSICRFQMLLLLPLLLLIDPIGLAIWSIVWGWHFVNYWQHKCLADRYLNNNMKIVRVYHLLQLMVADFCSWAIIPIQLAIPYWRRQW